MRQPLPDGRTSYTYDNLGRVTAITAPQADASTNDRGVTQYAYDAAGNLVSTTDPLGNKTYYGYDPHGNLVHQIQPSSSGATPVEHYFDFGASTTLNIEPGYTAIASLTYDNVAGYGWIAGSDLTAMVTQATGTALTRDAHRFRDATFEVAVPNGAYEVSILLGDEAIERDLVQIHLEGVQVGLADTEQFEHNWYTYTVLVSDGKLTLRLVDLGGSRDISQINALVVKQLLGPVTTFTYDDVGNRTSLTDPVGNTTSWTYDGLDRVIAETNALNKTRTFTYDAASNLLTRTDRNNRVIEYQYDALNRRTAELWKSGGSTVHTISYGYDLAGHLLSAGDVDAGYVYDYDDLGRVTDIEVDLAALTPLVVLTQTYDAASNRTSLASTIGGTADFRNDYAYDTLSRLTQITQSGALGGNAVAEKRVDFSYDFAGQLSAVARYADLLGTTSVAQSRYGYDLASRLTGLVHTAGIATIAGYAWTHDLAGRITSFTNTVHPGENAVYNYDNTDQLVGAGRPGTIDDEDYQYDDNGNRDTANGDAYTTGTNNQLLSDGTYDYEYDDEGSRLSKESIATGEREEYTWDHRNRLTQVTFKNSAGTVVKTVEYTYDYLNRWIGKVVDPDGAPTRRSTPTTTAIG